MTLTTIGELKEFLNAFKDDNIPVVIFRSNIEKSGYMQKANFRVETMKEEHSTAYDAFDGIDYSYQHFVHHPEGETTLVID